MMKKFDSVWDALEDDPIKRENLKLRSQLMIEINTKLKALSINQSQAAALLHTTQPRISSLNKEDINSFRLDMLIDFANRLGMAVSIHIAA